MPAITFNNSNNSFFQSVRKSVDLYFKTKKLKKTGNWKLYLKAWILIPGGLGIYFYLLSGHYSRVIGIIVSVLLGLTLVCIAFNVMHDACHNSYSERKWINSIMGLTMNALGSNAFLWKIKHNIIHHTYTNIDGIDDDIANSPLLRECTTQKWIPIHRFQFLYMFVLYSISTLSWMLGTDFVRYFAKKVHTTPISKISVKEHVIFWASKLLYVFFYVLVPIYTLGWRPWLTGFLVVHLTMGLSLSVVFQLAHVVEKTTFRTVEGPHKVIATEWAVHEVSTTADFAPQNKVISWLLGGLNFQIEHHLFPQISHIHYFALSEIVRRQCELFGIPYNCYPSARQAFYSHVRLMKRLGSKSFTGLPTSSVSCS
ncbi:acyl-CoA desaturase [Flavitalea sp. BT771]|uniref:fatty acid desaturase family protein n=1 Tax=Flavitalea sp. BT771 TaxID=3063329 RepID=UPI0026E47638|nr:acyl-CoA desaturase [Flavitalea sp. BT771]MDO6428983.1 acyl-CoA desaturase [Flavitalea sp. BT771]MDV6218889.1 acyl-CoA desaturase [Flavitalea sp. BT771]